ncbi:MAG: hypothetical protein GY711_09035 [bacterium]|nr:hypothetical protein [bacterium]
MQVDSARRFHRSIAPSVLSLVATSVAYAQVQPIDPVPHRYVGPEYYVDPEAGTDAARNGAANAPLQSIGFAMNQAATGIKPATIILYPGRYREIGGHEVWPIVMQPDVPIQGTNVLNTVLFNAFMDPDPILVFEAGEAGAFDDVLVDGVTMTVGKSGVLIQDVTGDLFSANSTFANRDPAASGPVRRGHHLRGRIDLPSAGRPGERNGHRPPCARSDRTAASDGPGDPELDVVLPALVSRHRWRTRRVQLLGRPVGDVLSVEARCTRVRVRVRARADRIVGRAL